MNPALDKGLLLPTFSAQRTCPIKDTGLDKGYFRVGPWEANQTLDFLLAVSKNINSSLFQHCSVPLRPHLLGSIARRTRH
jgi:hypothetical protein